VSIPFNLVIKDSQGRERTLEELLNARENSKGIELQLVYDLSKFDGRPDQGRLQFGYLRDGDSAWNLLEGTSPIAFDQDFGNATATTNHLTSK